MTGDTSAERNVLASVFNHGYESFLDISDIVKSDSFTIDSHQAIYRCLQHLYGDGEYVGKPDFPSIISSAKSLKLDEFLNRPDEVKHLRSLMSLEVEQGSARKAAAKVEKLSIARILSNQLEQSKQDLSKITGDEKLSHILGIAEKPVFDLSMKLASDKSDGPKLIGKNLREHMEYIASNPVQQIGISTGFPNYDKAIGGGLRKKTVNVVGARVKTGKTFFLDCVAINAALLQNIPVINLDTEMSEEDHWYRMQSNISGVFLDDIEKGTFGLSQEKKRKVFDAIDKLEKMPYYYQSVAGQSFEDMISMLRRWCLKDVGLGDDGCVKQCIILYDYLKLMSAESMADTGLAEFQVLGFQMTALHNFMVKYGTRAITTIQLNRDGITREDTDVASGSDRIMWLCSNFTILKPKSDEELAEQSSNNSKYPIFNRKLVPIVARHGKGLDSGDYINIDFQGQYGKMVEGPTRNQLLKGNPSSGFEVQDAENIEGKF